MLATPNNSTPANEVTGLVTGAAPGSAIAAPVSRRRFVLGATSAVAVAALPDRALALGPPATANASAAAGVPPAILTGREFDLHIGKQAVDFTGVERFATTVNGSLPGPILRWREGDRVTLRVTNHLDQDSSIHWHGIILPTDMDGVPHLSFPGIKPGATFEYQFDVRQNGTYWYHSHSGFQEQTGLFGSIIIDPQQPDPVVYDRDLVVILSDWSDESPQHIYSNLKKMSHYYNFRERTVRDLWRDLREKGLAQTWKERAMWNQMRMSETDIADVTGYTYTYLMNGVAPDAGWIGLFRPGEKVRLRFINGAAMSIFDVRIPGLKMTVVAADGQNIQPVEVDEFRIAVAETYDVIVEPDGKRAYTIFAQSNDRSGYARGTLTPDASWQAEIPAMDPAPILGHSEMGMAMSGMDHSGHSASGEAADHSGHGMNGDTVNDNSHDMSGMDHSSHDLGEGSGGDHDMSAMSGMDHSNHDLGEDSGVDHNNHDMSDTSGMDHSTYGSHEGEKSEHSGHVAGSKEIDHLGQSAANSGAAADRATSPPLAKAGFGSNFGPQGQATHFDTEYGPHIDNRSVEPQSGLADPGIGLRDHQRLYGRRVLTYADLKGLHPTYDKREPTREIELHLTGNMHRYMWSINGLNFSDAEPVELVYGERVRFILINDTMMTHPVHLHGMWSELETGDPDYIPRKHTVIVQPGARISYLVTADAVGRWAYHCHLMYHMPGMMREVRVVKEAAT